MLGGIRRDLFCNQSSMKIVESAEDAAILFSQFSCNDIRISDLLRIFNISLEGFNINRL